MEIAVAIILYEPSQIQGLCLYLGATAKVLEESVCGLYVALTASVLGLGFPPLDFHQI